MKKKDLISALKLVTPAVAVRDIVQSFTFLCFRDNTMTGFDGFVAVSTKIESGFDGLISAKQFQTLLNSFKGQDVEFKVVDEALTFKSGDAIKGRAAYKDLADFPDLKMWGRPKFKELPKDFLQAIHEVKFAAAQREANPILRGVQVDGKHIVGADNFRISLYELEEEIPFTAVLPRISAEVLAGVKDRALKGVAIHTPVSEEGAGLLFNFGDFRIFSQLIDGEPIVKKVLPFFDDYRGMIDLPEAVGIAMERAKIVLMKEVDREVIVSLGDGRVGCKSTSQGWEIEEGYDVRMHRRLKPVTFKVDPVYFSEVCSRAARVGYKGDTDPVYFESGSCKHLIQVVQG